MRRSAAYAIDAVALFDTTSASEEPATMAGGNAKNSRKAGTSKKPPPRPTTEPAKLVTRPATNSQTPLNGALPAGYFAVEFAKKCTVRQLAHTCLYAAAVNITKTVA
jgi:hypothetical protein